MTPDTPKREAKQPYETPKLEVHGTIEDLTQQIGLTTADGLTGSHL